MRAHSLINDAISVAHDHFEKHVGELSRQGLRDVIGLDVSPQSPSTILLFYSAIKQIASKELEKVKTYCFKDREVHAVRVFSENENFIKEFCGDLWLSGRCRGSTDYNISVILDRSICTIIYGKWLVKDENGTIQVISDEEFNKYYEETL